MVNKNTTSCLSLKYSANVFLDTMEKKDKYLRLDIFLKNYNNNKTNKYNF